MKNKAVALVAAFFMLGSLLFAPVRKVAANTYTKIVSVWILNSVIDSTPIGQTTPSSGAFSSFWVGNNALDSLPINVATTTPPSRRGITLGVDPTGDVTFWVSSLETSPGFFFKDSYLNTLFASITSAGFIGPLTGNVTGNLTGNVAGNLNGTVGASTPASGAFTSLSASSGYTGNVTGALTGNASTATQFASTPANCAAGSSPTGIGISGTAQNCNPTLYGTSRILANQAGCTPSTSTDSFCTGSFSFTAFADAGYVITNTVNESTGAFLTLSANSKSAGSFNYTITCTFNCSSIATPTVDLYLVHP